MASIRRIPASAATPTLIPLQVLACPAVRLRPKVMTSKSLLRFLCRPAHRRSAMSRQRRGRVLFHRAKRKTVEVQDPMTHFTGPSVSPMQADEPEGEIADCDSAAAI